MKNQAVDVIKGYYESFNQAKLEEFLGFLANDVIHDINEGTQEVGKELFRVFMEKMNRHYKERVTELEILANDHGTRVAAEFFIEGTYLNTDAGLPPAKGQKYRLRCGTFFELSGNKITRVTTYYNLKEWLSLVK